MANGDYALEHKTRRMIYNYILEHPGVSFSRIRRVFDMTKGTLRYHLRYLKKAEKIESKLESGKRCYYSAEAPALASLGAPGNLNPTQKHILTVIRDNPGITKRDLCRRTRFKEATVAYSLWRLVENRLVWKVRKGKAAGYEAITGQGLKQEVRALLVKEFLDGKLDEAEFLELKKRLEERRG